LGLANDIVQAANTIFTSSKVKCCFLYNVCLVAHGFAGLEKAGGQGAKVTVTFLSLTWAW